MSDENLINGKPESNDLTGWIEWAESIDGNPEGECASEWENSGGQYEIELVTTDYVLSLLDEVRKMNLDTEGFIKKIKHPYD